jgi:hypothetical protein
MYKELLATLIINGFTTFMYYYVINEFENRFIKSETVLLNKIKNLHEELADLKIYVENLEQDLKQTNQDTKDLKQSNIFLNKNLENYINVNYDTV